MASGLKNQYVQQVGLHNALPLDQIPLPPHMPPGEEEEPAIAAAAAGGGGAGAVFDLNMVLPADEEKPAIDEEAHGEDYEPTIDGEDPGEEEEPAIDGEAHS